MRIKQFFKTAGRTRSRTFTRIFALLAALFLLCFLCRTDSSAEQLWNEEYYRAVDADGELSEEEINRLDEICLSFVEQYHVDLALLALPSTSYPDLTIEELAKEYYEQSAFGFGETKDGFQLVWYTDTGEVRIVPVGNALDRIPSSYLTFAEEHILSFEEEYGRYGPMYACTKYLSNYLDEHPDSASKSAAALPENADAPTSQAKEAEAADTADTDDTDSTDAGIDAAVSEETDSLPSGSSDSAGTGSGQEAGEGASAQDGREAGGSDSAPDGQEAGGSDSAPDDPNAAAAADPSARVGEGSDMPAWYPADPEHFPDYFDADAPRVVDDADLFTDEETAVMENRLALLRESLGKDIVIFTDTSAHGLTHDIYAADFYDYNGYGIGEEHEGVCLMICMDPDDRGWWCCCTGPETRELYTETIANQIDDLLYEYMIEGEYYTGVSDWIENFRRLYTTGSPYLDEWAVTDSGAEDTVPDPDAPRVIDDTGLLTEEEKALLSQKAADLSGQYGLDIVIHYALHRGYLTEKEYQNRYYYNNGYGYDKTRDGIMLSLFKRPSYSTSDCDVFGSGAALARLTETNRQRLESRCQSRLNHTDYYGAADQWLDQVSHMLKTGRAPRSASSWRLSTIFELLAGAIFGWISLGRAKKKMPTPRVSLDADRYLVRDSLNVSRVSDDFLHRTTTRTYDPPKETRSSGGSSSSSGRSSYSKSYSGSSGRSHSGSGRKF